MPVSQRAITRLFSPQSVCTPVRSAARKMGDSDRPAITTKKDSLRLSACLYLSVAVVVVGAVQWTEHVHKASSQSGAADYPGTIRHCGKNDMIRLIGNIIRARLDNDNVIQQLTYNHNTCNNSNNSNNNNNSRQNM